MGRRRRTESHVLQKMRIAKKITSRLPLNRRPVVRWGVLILSLGAPSYLLLNFLHAESGQLPDFYLPQLTNANAVVSLESLMPRPALINVWASWCVACRTEHDFLQTIATSGDIPLFGLNFKDNRPDAQRWLAFFGDPYHFSIYDEDGVLGKAMQVDVLPVTFLIGASGEVLARHDGPLEQESFARTFKPLLSGSQEAEE